MPSEIAIWPVTVSRRIFGMKIGETRSAPRSGKSRCCSASLVTPPIAEPKRMPTLPDRTPRAPTRHVPAARPRARTGRCARAVAPPSPGRRPTGRSHELAGDADREPLDVEALMKPTPLRPATAASQVEGASWPRGVTAPKPVTATRRHDVADSRNSSLGGSPPGRTRRFRRWRPNSYASCPRAKGGPTSRSGTASAACSRTPAASLLCGRAMAGRCCVTSRSCGGSGRRFRLFRA